MARTTTDLLEQLQRHLPPAYGPLQPVLAGLAATLDQAESSTSELVASTTVEEAEGIWLTLLAQGYGVRRAAGESDSSLRVRLRAPERQMTVAAILDATNAILADVTTEEAVLVEHADGELWLDQDLWLDQSRLYDQHNAFTLEVPLVEEPLVGSSFVDHSFLDADLFLGEGTEPSVYAVIASTVERLRAAGVRWWLVLA